MSTHDLILKAACDVIAEEGIEHTTTRRIAERAGIHVGNIHYYFKSKQALLDAVAQQVLSSVITGVEEAPEFPDISELLDWLIDYTVTVPEALHVLTLNVLAYAATRKNHQLTAAHQNQLRQNCERFLEPWRESADARLPGGFEGLVGAVTMLTFGCWFAHAMRADHRIASTTNFLKWTLRDLTRG